MGTIGTVDTLGAAAFAAAFLGVAAYRLHKHDKGKSLRMWLFLVAAIAVTFSAAVWWPGLYRFTSAGIGIFILGAALAWGLFDFVLQVPLKHGNYHAKRTAYAAIVLGIAGMLTFANLTGIVHGIQSDVNGHGFTQVLSHVQKGNGG
jgi:hypothetical protein